MGGGWQFKFLKPDPISNKVLVLKERQMTYTKGQGLNFYVSSFYKTRGEEVSEVPHPEVILVKPRGLLQCQ